VSAELDLAAELLGELVDEVVFLGGATIGVWITDPAAPPVRVTKDVDAIVEATYAQLEEADVRACLAFGARVVAGGYVELTPAA